MVNDPRALARRLASELVLVGFAAAVYGGVRAVTEGSAGTAVRNAHAVRSTGSSARSESPGRRARSR